MAGFLSGLLSHGITEPPPPEYAGRGPAPGTTVTHFDDQDTIERVCREWLGIPARAEQGSHYQACYIPPIHLEVLPGPGIYPDPKDRQELADHEDAHSWGLVHVRDGRGWKTKTPSPSSGAHGR